MWLVHCTLQNWLVMFVSVGFGTLLLLPGNFCNVYATTDCLIVDFISNGCHVNDLEVFCFVKRWFL